MTVSVTIRPDAPVRRSLRDKLSRIAAVVGVPVDTFFTDPALMPQAGLIELIRLWDAAPTETVRAEILAGTRAVIAGAVDRAR